MYDASGKWPDGILRGNFNVEGSYSSCLEVVAEEPMLDGEILDSFAGRFCTMKFKALQSKNAIKMDSNSRGILIPALMPQFAKLVTKQYY